MKKFEQALNEAQAFSKAKERERITKERVVLLEAVCFNEGLGSVKNLSSLSEKKRAHVASLIREMWSPEKGMNERGKKYVFENEYTLSEKSSDESIRNYIISEVKDNIEEWLKAFNNNSLGELSILLAKEISIATKKEIKQEAVDQVIRQIFDEIVRARLSSDKK